MDHRRQLRPKNKAPEKKIVQWLPPRRGMIPEDDLQTLAMGFGLTSIEPTLDPLKSVQSFRLLDEHIKHKIVSIVYACWIVFCFDYLFPSHPHISISGTMKLAMNFWVFARWICHVSFFFPMFGTYSSSIISHGQSCGKRQYILVNHCYSTT